MPRRGVLAASSEELSRRLLDRSVFTLSSPLIKRSEDPHPIKPAARKQFDPVDRSDSALPGSLESVTRRPRLRRTVSPEGFPARWTFPSFRVSTRWADRPKAETLRTVSPKGFPTRRPLGLRTSRSDGRNPKASNPPNISTRRLPGRPDPFTRGLPDPVEPNPKTEFHDDEVKQNAKIDNKKFSFWLYFLVDNFSIFPQVIHISF